MGALSLFSKIASTYDLTNRILSFGMDLRWRKKLVLEIKNYKPNAEKILDLACGTGDVIKITKDLFLEKVYYVGLDPCGEMLNIARNRLGKKVSLIRGLAENLPFKGETFDAIFISFGLRNFSDRKKALDEIHRILRPKGVVSVLEFTKPNGKYSLSKLGWLYTKYAVPALGGVISGNFEAYRYLSRSIENFPSADKVVEEFSNTGFKPLKVKSLSPSPSVLFIFEKKLRGSPKT